MNKLDIDKLRAEYGDEQVKRFLLAELVKAEDSPRSFKAFYELVFERKLPAHGYKWIQSLYAARRNKHGLIVEAFRGSTKTTIMTIAFIAYRIGKEPEKGYLLVQVGDTAAKDSSQAVANIIEHNNGWAMAFPNVVPDKDVGWGDNGYNVKKADAPYKRWRTLCDKEKGKDPTLIGLGYKSRSIVGKHPTGGLFIDDILDENNTESQRELDKTMKIVKGTIMPVKVRGAWNIVVGTPWTHNDVLAYFKSTGEYEHAFTPAVDKDGNPVWPERFDLDELASRKRDSGSIQYARMYMLDLTAIEGKVLKREWLHRYPAEGIGTTWPEVWGVDFAAARDKLKAKEDDSDYFTLCRYKMIPGGGMVIVGGVRKRQSRGESQELIKSLGSIIQPSFVGVEAIGSGEVFYDLILSSTNLNVVPVKHGRKSKEMRIIDGLAPHFEFSRVWISDAVGDEFINAFTDEWVTFPLGAHDDCLDAAYMGLAASPYNLVRSTAPARYKPRIEENPFIALARS